jgi:hypothetical protein
MTIVKLSSKNFGKGLKYAKRVGGKYNPSSKTWELPDTDEVERMLRAAAAYGWLVVTPSKSLIEADDVLGIDNPAFWS